MNPLAVIAAAICMIACAGAGLGMGLATGRASEAIARQPEASGKINAIFLLGLALTESTAIYGLLVALLILFVKGGA